MSRKLDVDVLIVGLGPGGGAAAIAAARAGLRVAAIDRKMRIGEPVQCAEFIPLPLRPYVADSALIQQVTGMNSRLPSGVVQHSQFPGLMVDRGKFDRALAERAEQSGAMILPGTRLVSLDAKTHSACVHDREGHYDIAYSAVIAADGPHSPVASMIGLPRLRVVHTRQYTVPVERAMNDTEVWLSDEFAGGYAWLFPKGQVANLGLGTDQRFAADLKTPLERLRARLVEEGVIGAEILSRTGGAIPVGGMRGSLVNGEILFVGDAAGLTHPITGAGIAPAVISGEAAGEAAAGFIAGNARAFSEYEVDMRDQFEVSLARASARRRELESVWHKSFAANDTAMRRGWIAFNEFFSASELSGEGT